MSEVDPLSLADRVAIVSGSSRGIGLAIANALARHGAQVVITGRSAESLARARDSFGALAPQVVAEVCDIASDDDAAVLVERTRERFGAIDILVNNAAATARFGRLVNVPLDEWDHVMGVNVRGPLHLSRLCYPFMRAQKRGSIINIGSSEGLRLTKGIGTYAVSKAALLMLTRVCAREWASDGIRVNYLSPGIIDTEFSADLVRHVQDSGEHINPMRMIGKPEDIATMAVLLAGDAGRFITGAVIAIDGGETA